MVLVRDRVGVGRDRRGEHRHHLGRRVDLRAARDHVGPRERDQLQPEAEPRQVVDEDESHLALFLEPLDVNVLELDPALRIGGLREELLRPGEVLAVEARHADVAARRVRERARLEHRVAVVDLEQRLVVERVGERLPEVRVLRRRLLRVQLDPERRHAGMVGHDDARHPRDLVEVVGRQPLDDVGLAP